MNEPAIGVKWAGGPGSGGVKRIMGRLTLELKKRIEFVELNQVKACKWVGREEGIGRCCEEGDGG